MDEERTVVTITTREYRELIMTEFENRELFDEKKKLQEENDQLEEEISILKGMLMERMIKKYNFENSSLSELTDPDSISFPFDLKDLMEADISIAEAIDWIKAEKKVIGESHEN